MFFTWLFIRTPAFVFFFHARYGGDFQATMIFMIFFMLVGILINVLMVWGVHLKFKWLLWPWLAFHFAVTAVYFAAPVFAIYHTDYEKFILAAATQRWKACGQHIAISHTVFVSQKTIFLMPRFSWPSSR